LFVERGQGSRLGDPPRYPIDHPDLLGVQLAAPKRLPYGGQTACEATATGQQTAHRVRLVTQQQRQLVGDELAGPDPAAPT